jgi:hypothetical protein
MVVGVHTENPDPVEDGSGDIAMEVTEESNSDGEKSGGFDKLPDADKDKCN